jgi:signal transduction histidine kinase
MSTAPPFLAVPIRAVVAADGTLISADPPIWRLHILAGGDNDGPLAIPAMAALAAATARTKIPGEQPVRAADEHDDVELWVEANAIGDTVELAITGWRELPSARRTGNRERHVTVVAEEDYAIAIDSAQRIIRVPSFAGANVMGAPAGSVLLSVSAQDLASRLQEQQAFTGETIKLAGADRAYLLVLKPHHDANGLFLGHYGTLTPEAATPLDETAVTAMPVGRQFASVLKQPLSRIVANAETIGGRLNGPLQDNYAEYAIDIANAARHLSELVSDMEDLEAIDRPDFAVARDRIELGDIARRVAGLLALKASDHGMVITLPSDGERVEAIGEFRRVLQIMLNLVGNAIRYAPDGSTITIAIGRNDRMAVIEVSDEGSGVPNVDRERIFNKFERLGRSGDGGSGLGLFISRKLARAMGGDLRVGDAPGGGALFTLSLPSR